jgi:AcrR family transcriptional regulator
MLHPFPSGRQGLRDMTATRADAVHNRELVLRAAAQAFAAEGLEVPIGRVAQRAGVGAGTVYRHFPSKTILVEAVFAQHLDDLVSAADRWAAQATPADALLGFLFEVIEKCARGKYLCEALVADRSWPQTTFTAAARRFGEALNRLLHNAERAGAIAANLHIEDLNALIAGGATLCSAHPSRAGGRRLIWQLLNSLRRPGVTKDAELRNGERPESCAECGSPLRVKNTGRPARYCSPACRQRARRRRLMS